METQKIINESVGTKFRVVFEQAASTKGVMGFKVEANGDLIQDVLTDSRLLLVKAYEVAKSYAPSVEVK